MPILRYRGFDVFVTDEVDPDLVTGCLEGHQGIDKQLLALIDTCPGDPSPLKSYFQLMCFVGKSALAKRLFRQLSIDAQRALCEQGGLAGHAFIGGNLLLMNWLWSVVRHYQCREAFLAEIAQVIMMGVDDPAAESDTEGQRWGQRELQFNMLDWIRANLEVKEKDALVKALLQRFMVIGQPFAGLIVFQLLWDIGSEGCHKSFDWLPKAFQVCDLNLPFLNWLCYLYKGSLTWRAGSEKDVDEWRRALHSRCLAALPPDDASGVNVKSIAWGHRLKQAMSLERVALSPMVVAGDADAASAPPSCTMFQARVDRWVHEVAASSNSP